jgi:RNA polymerase sigma-70 factor (ECF subfamily)
MTAYATYTDQQLFELIRTGDKEAYTVVYSRFWAIIYRHARKMLRDEQEAEDLTQEVFYMLWNKAPVLEVKISLSGYLYTSVRNRILNRLEHGKIIAKYAASLEQHMEREASPTDYLIREKQLQELIEKEVSALPEQMRVVFELSRKQNLSYKEIALHLGLSEGAVRGQLTRALAQLRSKLGTMAFLYLILNNWK